MESDAEVGVFFSTEASNYQSYCGFLSDSNYHNNTSFKHRVRMGNISESASTFTAYKLNLSGPVYSVQSACSSSLVSVHVGACSILRDECQLALVGGAGLDFPRNFGIYFSIFSHTILISNIEKAIYIKKE
jgi:acyl transferase domain-containing protein